MPRKKYDDWVELAISLSINYKTAYTWVTSGTTEDKKRGGDRPRALSESQIEKILSWIEDD